MKIEILQPKISKKHNDSIWYDGTVAKMGKYVLVAVGDVEIRQFDKDGKYVGFYDGYKARDSFDLDMKDDSCLEKVSNEYGSKYIWEHNNWFEVLGDKERDYVLGDVRYTYDEGIQMLKDYYNEKIYETTT